MAVGIVVMGGSGRMGRMLCEVIDASDGARLVGVTEAPGHPWAGRDLGLCLGGAQSGVPVTDLAADVVTGADAVIDFTTPAATVAMAAIAAEAGAVHVIGTTGLADTDIAALDRAARRTAIVRAGNMSLGVNLLTQVVRQVAAALDEDYDIEIVEGHHRHKVDAPSGTALMLGEAAAEGRGVDLHAVAADRGRDGITGARARGAIGFPCHSRGRRDRRSRSDLCRRWRAGDPEPQGIRSQRVRARGAEGRALGAGPRARRL